MTLTLFQGHRCVRNVNWKLHVLDSCPLFFMFEICIKKTMYNIICVTGVCVFKRDNLFLFVSVKCLSLSITLILRFTQTPKKPHLIAIFLDLEKALNTAWKHGILSDLYDLDWVFPMVASYLQFFWVFWGHLPIFIDGFLFHWLFQVIAGPFSDTYEQEMSVPQGSTLSLVLFSHEINNIVRSAIKGSKASLL